MFNHCLNFPVSNTFYAPPPLNIFRSKVQSVSNRSRSRILSKVKLENLGYNSDRQEKNLVFFVSLDFLHIYTYVMKMTILKNIYSFTRVCEFVNKTNQKLMAHFNIKQSVPSAYHPKTNGLDERTNLTVKVWLVMTQGHIQK